MGMATYHFSVKNKSKGYAKSHYSYICRLGKYEGIRKSSKETVEWLKTDGCMPNWVKDPMDFWTAADQYERKNAKVYMEYELALPQEFDAEQRQTLLETFIEAHIASHGYPYSCVIHNVKSRIEGQSQPHCHLMFSLRANDGIERTAEQYFKRYNPDHPEMGGARKKQLQEDHKDYSEFLLYIRKQWELHLNDALNVYAPTVIYEIKGRMIEVPNRVDCGNYKEYNEKNGTMYLAEPKLGAGKRNENIEYLTEIEMIREHNRRERDLENYNQFSHLRYEYHLDFSNEPSPTIGKCYEKELIKPTKDKAPLKKESENIFPAQPQVPVESQAEIVKDVPPQQPVIAPQKKPNKVSRDNDGPSPF